MPCGDGKTGLIVRGPDSVIPADRRCVVSSFEVDPISHAKSVGGTDLVSCVCDI